MSATRTLPVPVRLHSADDPHFTRQAADEMMDGLDRRESLQLADELEQLARLVRRRVTGTACPHQKN